MIEIENVPQKQGIYLLKIALSVKISILDVNKLFTPILEKMPSNSDVKYGLFGIESDGKVTYVAGQEVIEDIENGDTEHLNFYSKTAYGVNREGKKGYVDSIYMYCLVLKEQNIDPTAVYSISNKGDLIEKIDVNGTKFIKTTIPSVGVASIAGTAVLIGLAVLIAGAGVWLAVHALKSISHFIVKGGEKIIKGIKKLLHKVGKGITNHVINPTKDELSRMKDNLKKYSATVPLILGIVGITYLYVKKETSQ